MALTVTWRRIGPGAAERYRGECPEPAEAVVEIKIVAGVKHAYLEDLWAEQGHGYGTELLNEAEAFSKGKGCTRIGCDPVPYNLAVKRGQKHHLGHLVAKGKMSAAEKGRREAALFKWYEDRDWKHDTDADADLLDACGPYAKSL